MGAVMPVFIASMLVQVLFAYHAYKTGRDRWVFIILIFPGMGSLLYFLIEVLPELLRGPKALALKGKLKKAMDPEKDYRTAKYAVDTTPTVANRTKFAQVLMAREDYDGAIAVLQPALANHFADDPMLLEGLAYAYFYKGDFVRALEYVEQIYNHKEWPPKDYIKLLRARLYQKTGDADAALQAFNELVPSFPGEEARICLAQLHEEQGRTDDAQAIYREILTRARHAPRHYQHAQRAWISQAKRLLK